MIFNSAFELVIAIILCEAITELVVGSALLARWRNRMLGPDEQKPRLFGILVACGYCLSVWTAMALTFAMRDPKLVLILAPFSTAIVVHRASNVLHVAISFTFKLLEAIVSRIAR